MWSQTVLSSIPASPLNYPGQQLVLFELQYHRLKDRDNGMFPAAARIKSKDLWKAVIPVSGLVFHASPPCFLWPRGGCAAIAQPWVGGEQASAEVAVMQARSPGPMGVTLERGAHTVFCVHKLRWEELRDPPSRTCGAWAGWAWEHCHKPSFQRLLSQTTGTNDFPASSGGRSLTVAVTSPSFC